MPVRDRKSDLKVINLNFQSAVKHKDKFQQLLDDEKPDIIIGTETMLDPSKKSSKFIDTKLYNVYRKDNLSGESYNQSYYMY